MEIESLKIRYPRELPEEYTGIVEWENGTKEWLVNGKLHRIDGPAFESSVEGYKGWYLDNIGYSYYLLFKLINESIFLGTENGKYDLLWLRFFSNQGIKEFPIIPGMKEIEDFQPMFKKLSLNI